MKILAIRLSGIGQFGRGVALEGLSGGLDVLAGPNELGKSTVFRALETVFHQSHASKSAAVEVLRSGSGSEMTIEADFEVAGERWRITKIFGRGASAELSRLDSGTMVARRQEAEERLAGLLGIATGRPGPHGLLWVAQGRSLEPADPDLSGKDRGERSALLAAIEREVENAAGGAQAREVRRRVAKVLDELTTPRDRARARKNSAYDLALRRRDALAEALAAARKSADETEARRSELARLRERRAAIGDPRARSERELRREAASAALQAALKAIDHRKIAAAERDAKAAGHRAATKQLREFDAALEAIARAAEALREDTARLSELEAAHAGSEAARDKLRLGVAELGANEREAAARLASVELHLVRDRIARADAAAARLEAAGSAVRGNPLTPERVASIDREANAIALIEAQLAAAAPHVRIDYAPGGAGRIRLAGTPVADGSELRVPSALVLEIEGVGRITVAPGADQAAEDDRADLAAHREQLATTLAALGVASAEAARARLDDRRAAEQALGEARAELAGLAPAGLAAIRRDEERLAKAAATSEGAAGLTLEQALAERAFIVSKLDAARNGLAAAERAFAAAALDLARLKARIEERTGQHRALDASLVAPAVRPAERSRLAEQAAVAQRAAEQAELVLSALAEAAPADSELERLKRENAAAAADVEKAGLAMQDLERQIARLEGELEAADEASTGTAVERVAGELDRAKAEVTRLEARIAALALLADTLEEAEAQARDRFLAPVSARIGPYLSVLFPEARLVLGEGFSATALERAGLAEQLGVLSNGTREQIAILTRCAFGRLLADAGTPAPLILDDALVYSDDSRIERMFAVLSRAAQFHQVVVFTCRERTFERLSGHKLHLMSWPGH